MTRQTLSDLAARAVRRLRSEPPPSLPRDRKRLVAAVEGALQMRARRRKATRRFVATAGVSVAAALTLFLVGHRVGAPPVGTAQSKEDSARARTLTVLGDVDESQAGAIFPGARPVPLLRGMTLEAGIRLVAPVSSEVRVGTAEGTSLTLEAGAEITVSDASATERFALSRGAVRAHVARLVAGERFIIDTPDAEVEVHGTVFRVSVAADDSECRGGSRTRVSVSEGVVSVRAAGVETRVSPGQRWPAGCAVPSSPATSRLTNLRRSRLVGLGESRTTAAPTVAAATSANVAPAFEASPPSVHSAVSSLGAQNDLFAAASAARNRGDAAAAARLFAQLTRDYPRGPLLESALVQRMKALASFDVPAAARAAADYLDRFPTGVASAEARRLVDAAR